MDNDLKFTIIWELGHFPKSTESHLDRSIDFIRGLTFWSRTYSESPQNFRSYDILHDHVVSVAFILCVDRQNCQNGCRTVYLHAFSYWVASQTIKVMLFFNVIWGFKNASQKHLAEIYCNFPKHDFQILIFQQFF